MGLLAGCAQLSFDGALQVWAVPEHVALSRETLPEPENDIFSQTARRIRLDAAINETIAFQLALRTASLPVRVTGVSLPPFERGQVTFPPESVEIFREQWILASQFPSWYLRLTPHLSQPREIADPLIPLSAPAGALPLDVRAGRTEAFWIRIQVPVGTEEGEYQSQLRIALQGGQTRDLRVTLTVFPFALPQSRHFALITGVDTATLIRHHIEVDGKPYAPARLTFDDPLYTRAATLIDDTMRLLHDRRCSPLMSDVQPLRRINPSGEMEIEWSDYDRLVASLIDGTAYEDRAASIAWPLPVSEREPAPSAFGGWGSPGYHDMLRTYLRECVAHFEQKGWLDRHFLWISVPATERGERYRQFEQLARLAHEVDPRINVVCDLTPQPMTEYGWQNDPFIDLTDVVRTWATPARLMDPSALARQRERGKTTWLSCDQPPYSGSLSVLAGPAHARSVSWEAFRYGLTGVLLPCINRWPVDGVPRAEESESTVIWPGKAYGLSSPVPSIRLERLLRGAQDYEYLWLLQQNQRGAIARIIAADLFSYGGTQCYGEHFLDGRPHGWVSDPVGWSLARRVMAREIAAAVAGSGSQEAGPTAEQLAESLDQQMEWRRLAQTVRQVRSQVEGVRVQLAEKGSQNLAMEVQATVSAFNATRQPFTATLQFSELPAGWKAAGDPASIEALPPGRLTRRVVRAQTDTILPSADGVLPVQIQVDPETQPISGRLCVLTSQHLTRPLQVDGRLDDWPLGTTNVAADFVLVGAQEIPKEGRRTPDRPALGTTVFVCHDAEYLYVAFNCEDDANAPRHVTRSNAVAYDGLWPTGEDVLEIIIDPTGRALAPGDVLHILLKMNGVVITEHGAPCLTPVAPCSPWTSGVIGAVDERSHAHRRTAEIRIPVKSLGPLAPIFGINFARYTARLGEYASWSGARRYLYSPVTLGNIRLGQ